MKKNEEWKGYTMAELKQRRVVNRIKSELLTEQIKAVGTATMSNVAAPGGNLMGQVEKYAGYAITGVKLFKQIRAIYSAFK